MKLNDLLLLTTDTENLANKMLKKIYKDKKSFRIITINTLITAIQWIHLPLLGVVFAVRLDVELIPGYK